MGPINYYTPLESPLQAATQGLQFGMAARQAQAQQQAQQQALQMQQAEMQRQQQLQQAMGQLGRMGKSATYEDYNRVALMLPKEQADSMRAAWEGLNKVQQTSQLQFGGQVFSAVQRNPEMAVQMLNARASAERNSGNEEQAKAYETWAKLAETSPEQASQSIGVMLSQLPGGGDLIKNVGALGGERRAQELQASAVKTAEADAERKSLETEQTPERLRLEAATSKATAANLYSQMADRAKQYSLDERRFAQETAIKLAELRQTAGALTPASEKLLNDATIASQTANSNATNLLDLADRFQKADLGSGFAVSLGDRITKLTGNQGEAQALRKEYTRLRNTNVISSLPPGAASDRDISTMMAGFPEENADPTHVAAFMRGMAKAQRYSAIDEGVRAEWVAQNGSMRPAKSDMVINGVVVPAGASMIDVLRTAKQDMYDFVYKQGDDNKQAGQNVQRVNNASYMGFAGAQLVNQ